MGEPARAFHPAFIRDLDWERVWDEEKGSGLWDREKSNIPPRYKDDLIMQEWRQENDNV